MNSTENRHQKKLAPKTSRNAKLGPSTTPTPGQWTRTIQESIDLAVQHHNAGDLPKAEGIYQQILQANPNHPVALRLLGVVSHQEGKNDIAVDLITKALAIKPDYVEAYSNLGAALHELGKLDEAVASYDKALTIKPDYVIAHYNLGKSFHGLGKLGEAVESYHRAIAINPDYAEAYNNLGNALQDLGKLDEAVASYSKAIAIKPDYAEAHSNLGVMHYINGRLDDAEKCYRTALELKPSDTAAIDNLGSVLLSQGKSAEALEYCRKALELNPNSINANLSLARSFDGLVPVWHTAMMNDDERNDAYLTALQTAITADTHVLEIGTGSGLLAMMAARSGAKQVTTCEASPIIATTAKEIIAANGMADVINVIAKKSNNIEVGADLPRPADLLVSEIFSDELLGESVLPSIEDAKRRLLSPEGRIIPGGGSIMIALFGGEHIGKNIMVDDVSGFDMRKFNSVTSKQRHLRTNDYDIELLTDDVEAFNFDFNRNNYFPPEQKTLRVSTITAGKCYGIIQWNRLQMDDSIVFENHPSIKTPASGWKHVVYILGKPINVEPNQIVVITAMHNRIIPWFALENIK